MARTPPFHIVVILGLLLAAGCQQGPSADQAAMLPPPNLDAPPTSGTGSRQPASVARPAHTPKPAPASVAGPRPDVPADWIPEAPANRWQWIVVHHSATLRGCAASFDRDHRLRGWDELGYHFVIGNGTLSGDGQVEVGSRWAKQKWGAHAKTADNRYNDFGIGICLVGDFERNQPTAAQMRSLVRLCAYLMHAYRIPPERVIGHGETKPTSCPGRNMSLAAVRQQIRQYHAANYGSAAPAAAPSATPAPCSAGAQ